MNVVIAIDSFKGSLSSLEAGESAANGIKKVYPDATTVIRPLADGGEGTVDALVAGCGGKMTTVSVTGPLGETVSCQYGIVSATKTAIIEMAVAAGITLVPPQKKNPLHTTTYGVGEIIADAVKRGCRQKGADSEMINMMDRWLKDYALLSRKYFPDVNESLSGAGAAGGLGFAFLTFLHATLESGIKIVLEETKLRDYIQKADIVVTGEGRLDGQTVMGKAPIGVAKIAKEYGKPVIAFSGCVTKDAIACNEHGIDAFFPVLRSVSTLDEAMCRTNAMQNIEDTAEQVFRLIRTFSH